MNKNSTLKIENLAGCGLRRMLTEGAQVEMVAGTGSNLNLREGATIRIWERKKAARLGAADIRDLASQGSLVAGAGFEPAAFRL